MFLRRLSTFAWPERSAFSAKERLMHDGVMRASRSRRVASAHRVSLESVPGAEPSTRVPSRFSSLSVFLSPQEQRRRVMDVARSFEGHYLAAIDFMADRNLTVGTVKPVRSTQRAVSEVVQICVDAQGNVSICQLRKQRQSVSPVVAGLWLMGVLALCAVIVLAL